MKTAERVMNTTGFFVSQLDGPSADENRFD